MTEKQKFNSINYDLINLLNAYCEGFFPMANEETGEIHFYSPEIRAIFPIYELKIPKSLKKFLEKNPMNCTINHDFNYIIKCCSQRETTWISDEIIEIYCQLHRIGFAHSVETWFNGEIGRASCRERV